MRRPKEVIMGFIVLIRLVAVALGIWLLLRFVRNKNLPKKQNTDSLENAKMVRCHYCDTHVPSSEAIQDGDHWYCSIEHAKRGGE